MTPSMKCTAFLPEIYDVDAYRRDTLENQCPVHNCRRIREVTILVLVLAFGTLGSPSTSLGWTKNGTVYATNGSQSDVQAAIDNSSAGDTVNVPVGSFSWSGLDVNRAITLSGGGRASTKITGGPITISAAATVKSFEYVGRDTMFQCANTSGWRITDILASDTGGNYFALISGVYGLIDSCDITGSAGNNELIFARGPTNSWQTDNSLGGAANVFIEDCQFRNLGYVTDINANGRAVVRFCTIGPKAVLKVDGHGKASNTPPRGVREMEVYKNAWTDSGGFWAAIELRGGTGMVFDNTSVDVGWLILTDYAATGVWPNFGRLMTAADWPIDDQIGVGKDPKVGGSEPMYLWGNRQGGVQWAITVKTGPGIIEPDRDYFSEISPFDGSAGVGRGTAAQMAGIRPRQKGIGFWVTDEGEWNSTHTGADGRLYVSDGSAWVLKYTPYPYPHPLRTGVSAPAPAPQAPSSPTQAPSSSLTFEAESGTVQAPFVAQNGYIQQFGFSSVDDGGRAAYSFTITDPGDYLINATVNTTSGGSNSVYINIDAEPVDPTMIWDIEPLTTAFELRTCTWRGNGTFDANEFSPKLFSLTAGTHTLVIRGREPNTQIDSIEISKASSASAPFAPNGLRVVGP